jgi:hypothetical protein
VVTTKELLPGDIISLSFKKRTSAKRAAQAAQAAQAAKNAKAIATTAAASADGAAADGTVATNADGTFLCISDQPHAQCRDLCPRSYIPNWFISALF